MNNVTIPLPDDLVEFLDAMVVANQAETRTGLVRRVLSQWRDDAILATVREAKKEYKCGKYHEGDLRTIVQQAKERGL